MSTPSRVPEVSSSLSSSIPSLTGSQTATSPSATAEAALATAQYEASSTLYGTNDPVEILYALLTFAAMPYHHAHLGLIASEDAPGIAVQESERTLEWLAQSDGGGIVSASDSRRKLADYPAFEALSAVEALHIEAVDSDPFLTDAERAILRQRGVGGLLVIPLVVGQRLIGVVAIEQETPTAIDAMRLRALRRLSDQAAVVLENARLLRDVQIRADQLTLQVRTLQTINKLATALSTFSDDSALMDYATRQITEALGGDHAGLIMFNDDDTGTVVSEYPALGAQGSRLNMADNALFDLMLVNMPRPTLANHVQQNPLVNEQTRTLLKRIGIDSIMITPVIVNGRLVGSLGIDIYDSTHVFTPEMADFAQTMVSQLMIGLDNLTLLREARERADQLERVARNEALVNQISIQMQRTNDVETIVRDTIKALGEALHAREVRVRFAVETARPLERTLLTVPDGNGHRALDPNAIASSHPDAPDEQWS